MMTLANYGIKSNKYKDPVSAKSLNKSLQIRNKAESSLKHCIKIFHRLPKERRNDLVESLQDYYSRVPFNALVWNTNESEQCIINSIISDNHQFNPYRARDAFRTIEEMLINLEYLPWHKEFTRILTYGGGFRHYVAEPLVGAESILRVAGFEEESDNNPTHLVIRPRRTSQMENSDLNTQIIFDTLLAQVVISDIIDVFENCCKISKVVPSMVPNTEVNCYTWIQHYFRERSHQIKDKACAGIQELLNNTTNHLTKLRITSVKSSSRNDRLLDESTHDKVIDVPHSRGDMAGDYPSHQLKSSSSNYEPPRIPGDLLRIPDYSDHRIQTRHDSTSYGDAPSDSLLEASLSALNSRESLSRDHVSHRFHDSNIKPSPKLREYRDLSSKPSEDFIDFSIPEMKERFLNDREPLIPKQERKYAAPTQREYYRQDRGQLSNSRQPYRLHAEIAPTNHHIDQLRDQPVSSMSKANHEDSSRFRDCSTSQLLQATSRATASRYDSDTDNRNYEYRDADRTFGNRFYWSCGTCTFYNHANADNCVMCGNRKTL